MKLLHHYVLQTKLTHKGNRRSQLVGKLNLSDDYVWKTVDCDPQGVRHHVRNVGRWVRKAAMQTALGTEG